jgi:uncharacterized repeat protein (TIGR03803 family)
MSPHPPRIVAVCVLLLTLSSGAAAQTVAKYERVHAFSVGERPYGALIEGTDGALYGTLRSGPAMVFRMTLAGTLTVLRNADSTASEPLAGLVQGTDGAFYGTTSNGDAAAGTVFRLTSSGEFTVLHAFTAALGSVTTDGGHPGAALIQARDGMLYGTTRYGGTGGTGVVFRITTDGTYTTLRSFPSQADLPEHWNSGPLLQPGDRDDLYGTMPKGGAYGRGFIFRTAITDADPYSAPVVLHDFRGAPDDGDYPEAPFLEVPGGDFYTTTYYGGAWNLGAVIRVTPSGTVTIVHSFAGGADDGALPTGGVILARDGNFYGATHDGGTYNLGVAYRMTPSGEVTVLHSFERGLDGASPYAGLVETGDGALYGMTAGGGGGSPGAGTVYRIRFVSIVPVAPVQSFDADAVADMPLYDATTGTWRILTSTSGYVSSQRIFWGGPDYTPVPADYDGDGRLDVAVYHAGRGIWYILTSSSNFTSVLMKTWGGPGKTPVPGDYDGDRRADLGVYDVTTGAWQILTSSTGYGSAISITLGGSGNVPVPGDYDGDSLTDPAVYARATGAWRVLTSSTDYTASIAKTLGGPDYAPVPGDYDGDFRMDFAVYHKARGDWSVLSSSTNFTTGWTQGWGGTGYTPVPGDYDGDNKTDLAVYNDTLGEWFVLQSSSNFTTTLRAVWGDPIEQVVTTLPRYRAWTDALRATDFDGDGASDLAVYEPTTGVWSILTSSSHFTETRTITWGGTYGDVPVPGDYDGDGITDPAVFNPATGTWAILRSSLGALTITLGTYGDIPVPGDYDGDGITDPAVYTPWTGAWQMRWSSWSSSFANQRTVTYGAAWLTPVRGDYDGDGITDLGLYDPYTGHWQVLLAKSNYATPPLTMAWGGPGYAPMPADFDGDGKNDFGVCLTSTGQWWVLKSGFTYTSAFGVVWGEPIDAPLAGDYDGDGIADLASYDGASGAWVLRLSSSGFTLTMARTLGGPGFVLPRAG